MLRRDRRRLDIAGDSQLSRIKTEQAILNFFDRDHLGNRLSVFRDNEFCLLACTSSIIARHLALNSPAAIVFKNSTSPWSSYHGHIF